MLTQTIDKDAFDQHKPDLAFTLHMIGDLAGGMYARRCIAAGNESDDIATVVDEMCGCDDALLDTEVGRLAMLARREIRRGFVRELARHVADDQDIRAADYTSANQCAEEVDHLLMSHGFDGGDFAPVRAMFVVAAFGSTDVSADLDVICGRHLQDAGPQFGHH